VNEAMADDPNAAETREANVPDSVLDEGVDPRSIDDIVPPILARPLRYGPGALGTRANVITVSRLVLAIPLLILISNRGASWLVTIGWVVLAATDGLDGWVARKDGTTRSGAFLDPIADKMLVLGAFFALVVRSAVPLFPVLLIAAREFGISGYRSWLATNEVSVPAGPLGKVKTVAQLASVFVCIFPPTDHLLGLQHAALWVAVALTVVSGVEIVVRGQRELATRRTA